MLLGLRAPLNRAFCRVALNYSRPASLVLTGVLHASHWPRLRRSASVGRGPWGASPGSRLGGRRPRFRRCVPATRAIPATLSESCAKGAPFRSSPIRSLL